MLLQCSVLLLLSLGTISASVRGNDGGMYLSADGDMMVPEMAGGDIPCPGPFPRNSLQIIHCKGKGKFVFEVMNGAYCCTIQAGTEDKHSLLEWRKYGKEIIGKDEGDRLGVGDGNGNGVVLSGNGKIVAVASRYSGVEAFDEQNSGAVRVYKETTFGWTQIGQTIEGYDQEMFGYSLSLSHDGKTIAIGGVKYEGEAGRHTGRVMILDYFDDEFPGYWEQRGDVLEGMEEYDQFGHSVSLCELGTVVAIGAVQHQLKFGGTYEGYVQIFEWNLNQWRLVGDTIYGEEDGDAHGNSISLSSDGRVLAIGARHHHGEGGQNSGYVRVYRFFFGAWEQVGDEIHGQGEEDHFGGCVSLSEDGYTVAVGAEHNDGVMGKQTGHARIFRYQRDIDRWVQIGQEIEGEDEGHGAGISVALSGNSVAVGSIRADSADGRKAVGHVRTFEYNVEKDEWVQFGDAIFGNAEFDNLGHSVSLSRDGSRLAVSIPNADRHGKDTGAVQVYKLGTNDEL